MEQQTIDSAVAQRLLQVFPLNVTTTLHVSNGSGHFQQTLPRAYRKTKTRQGFLQPNRILHVKRTKLPDPGIIQPRIQPVLTGILSRLGSNDPLAYIC